MPFLSVTNIDLAEVVEVQGQGRLESVNLIGALTFYCSFLIHF